MAVIEIKNLLFSYEKDIILENINLTVKPLDFLAIIGPNGGGKSTLIKLILGLLKPTKGTICTLGRSSSKPLSSIGYVPQNTNINTDFPIKVLEVVLMGHVDGKKPLWGYGKEEIVCAMGALTQVGMEHYAQSKIGDLSGGQRQRVMIARALCACPKILMLDEPTSSIDIKGQKEIYELLKQLNKTITIIVVSHDISVILEYANKAAHVNKRLAFHDISNKQKTFHTHGNNEHFCEIELLQLLGAENCESCLPADTIPDDTPLNGIMEART
ncbi:MAG: ABC transporter ATP-binding protein [Sulfurovum sp.]|nr:ABC transporter ATP-binding protein [Sulfurovum sp.]MCB4745632.1 ABC transporter ATP-binding protein [Sulfurovum sp.]MCB4748467.1 ABC transporter ATP-binding protein [Sulfurovum sp.]MCB4751685.1 ABC transporter ATP-binding protein [Sulfurovum sp.]MCB4754460.1 ABC transporter ATP-binding protein [Sulfurovum sp.]